MNSESEVFVQVGDQKILVEKALRPTKPEGLITDEKLPIRFGNRQTRRKLQSQIRKIKDV